MPWTFLRKRVLWMWIPSTFLWIWILNFYQINGNHFQIQKDIEGLLGNWTISQSRLDISLSVSVVSQFLNSPTEGQWDAVICIQIVGYSNANWASSPIDRRYISGYWVFIGGNLTSCKSKKQNVVTRSSVAAEYRVMASTTCELIWLKKLLQELRFAEIKQMTLICNNQAALHITSTPMFHERTKHNEIDCHFIKEN